MSQKGDLEKIKFEKLLIWLSRQKKNGTLRLTRHKKSKYILFESGHIISAFSEFPEDNFRAVIRRMELLPPTQQAELELEPGTSDVEFAKKVIEKGYVTEREFLEVLKRQNKDIILSLFEWRVGSFVFFENQLPDSQPISLKMPLTGIIELGIERSRKSRQLSAALPEQAFYRLVPGKKLDDLSNLAEKALFSCLEEPLTLRDIVTETGLTEFEVATILNESIQKKLIEVLAKDVTEVPEDIRKVLADAEILHARGHFWEAWTRIRKVVRKIPGNPELQLLFRKYSRDFKNDLNATIQSTSKVPVVIKTVDDAFFGRFPQESALGFILSRIDSRSSIKELNQVLNVDTDKLMLTLYLLKKASVIKFVDPQSPIPREVVKRRQFVRNIWEKMQKQNYYEILGVNQDDPQSQIKAVYFELAKQFHPDKRPKTDSEDINKRLDQIFNGIRNAYQVLSDPARRDAYNQELATETQDIEIQKSRSKAQLQYRVGLKAFQSRKYRTAMEYFRSAIDLDPYEATYYFKMAELCARNPKWYRAGVLAGKKAIQLDPEIPEYHAVMGILLRLEGHLLEAEKEFFATLKYDPENKTARRELEAMGKAVPELENKKDTRYTPVPRKKKPETNE